MDIARATTPPNLFGIDRKIAYANKKYHSGWIWIGVFKGLAKLKFSGSPIINGVHIDRVDRTPKMINMEGMSFLEKNGWKFIISIFWFLPKGLLEPVWCRNAKWIKTIAVTISGTIKWRVKKRFKVAFPIEKPPHNHSTVLFPMYGIADRRLVITVAPQKDICPQGST